MKPKECVYVGEPVPDLMKPQYSKFLLHLQKSILYSLEKRNLLTHVQKECCIAEIEKVVHEGAQQAPGLGSVLRSATVAGCTHSV